MKRDIHFLWRTAGITLAVSILAASQALGTFVAYNDCMGPGGNPLTTKVTYYCMYDEDVLDGENNVGWPKNPTGLLMDYATGTWTSVTATMTGYNLYPWGSSGAPPVGSPADGVFGGILDLKEFQSYYATGYGKYWYYTVEFTGLDPSKAYEFVTTANRGSPSYDEKRWAKFSIVGADAYANASSSGVLELAGAGVLTMDTGYNGDIVKWTGILSGADGSFSVRSENIGSVPPGEEPFKSYGLQGFMLAETDGGGGPVIPEPVTVLGMFLGLGSVGAYIRRRWAL